MLGLDLIRPEEEPEGKQILGVEPKKLQLYVLFIVQNFRSMYVPPKVLRISLERELPFDTNNSSYGWVWQA